MRRLVLAVAVSVLTVGCGWRPFTRRPAGLPPGVQLGTVEQRRAAFAEAYAVFRRGNLERALPIFRALADCDPQLEDYELYFVGLISERLGKERVAATAFERVLSRYPQSVEWPAAALAYGELLVHDGRISDGRSWLQSARDTADRA